MDNIDFFKKELAKSLKYYIGKEVGPRILQFIKNEVTLVLDRKINELRKDNDNTIKSQHSYRKSKNTNSTKRVR